MVVTTRIGHTVHEPSADTIPGGSARSVRHERLAHAALLLVCLASRLATTVHYVEDIDSLHFALAMIDFDVARLQPHFPGYVVFVALAQACSAVAGSFAMGFALVGGIATFAIVTGMLRLLRWELVSLRGIGLSLLLVGNGMLWVYANRYMPDLLGVALLLWCVHDLCDDRRDLRLRGAFLAALLAGTRLSYLPFLLPFAAAALAWRTRRVAAAGVFALGVVLWSIPLVATTGWSELQSIALNQTAGHFDDFGGTVRTEPHLMRRASRMIEGVWADALGGYVPGRSELTVIAGSGVLIAMTLAARSMLGRVRRRKVVLVVAGIACYVVWIFLYQNVIHHSRHLLPLVPFAIAAVAYGLHRLAQLHRFGAIVAAAFASSMVVVGATLGVQHRQPSALAQAGERLRALGEPLTVISTELVNYYLASTGVRARFVAVDAEEGRRTLSAEKLAGRVVSVGDYREHIDRPVQRRVRFYHNPHVNRIWPVIELYEFGSADTLR